MTLDVVSGKSGSLRRGSFPSIRYDSFSLQTSGSNHRTLYWVTCYDRSESLLFRRVGTYGRAEYPLLVIAWLKKQVKMTLVATTCYPSTHWVLLATVGMNAPGMQVDDTSNS
jgi:hypothetical protein